MNVEELRDYCLSLSPEVEEKFPFQKFGGAKDILVFYIGGHMFCYFDINHTDCVSMKSTEEEATQLREQYDYIGLPHNASKSYARRWIGIDIARADDSLVKRLILNSFCIVGKRSK
ncbi:MmcQ/YjbR family DNA-binding protein [Prevotella sp. HUN102]|uniref:MmcQ/YjbR family DNA-binding protein n=1 Tax=Prevotella sp. HUN102 TaxID=1392486 RepID=UPI00048FFD14|nr:MmcQ/YjbR family DNA-binding protein [Prevotella sp. HUN102]